MTFTALERALSHSGPPEIHHSDQGVQYASERYTDLPGGRQVCCVRLKWRPACSRQVSMATVGRPTENAHAERLIRTLKEEEVYLHEYETFEEAQRRIGHFLESVYMHKRIHSSLGYLTPAEFEAAYQWEIAGRKVG